MLLNKVGVCGVGWAEKGKGEELGSCNRITVKNYSIKKCISFQTSLLACRGPAAAESRGSRRCYEASAMGDRRHHASEDSEALFRLLQAQMDFYIFLFGID